MKQIKIRFGLIILRVIKILNLPIEIMPRSKYWKSLLASVIYTRVYELALVLTTYFFCDDLFSGMNITIRTHRQPTLVLV